MWVDRGQEMCAHGVSMKCTWDKYKGGHGVSVGGNGGVGGGGGEFRVNMVYLLTLGCAWG